MPTGACILMTDRRGWARCASRGRVCEPSVGPACGSQRGSEGRCCRAARPPLLYTTNPLSGFCACRVLGKVGGGARLFGRKDLACGESCALGAARLLSLSDIALSPRCPAHQQDPITNRSERPKSRRDGESLPVMLLLSPAALGESSSPSTACVCSRIPSRSLASSSFAAASALEPSGERRSSPPTAEASCQPDESRAAEVSAALSVELSAASVCGPQTLDASIQSCTSGTPG